MTYLYVILAALALAELWAWSLYNPDRVWIIPKGAHYCLLRQRIPYFTWWVLTGKMFAKSMNYRVVFNSTCMYNIGKNQADWNKLPGFQKGFDKTNRELAGWRYLPANDDMETTWYRHLHGHTMYGEGRDVRRAESIKDHIWPDGDISLWKKCIRVHNLFRFALPLFPYFGGDETAPHRIEIGIFDMRAK